MVMASVNFTAKPDPTGGGADLFASFISIGRLSMRLGRDSTSNDERGRTYATRFSS